ncbi:LysR family transcriptional regulator [Marininema halotolerans]|uniref:DNA-binding transcriptional regulator, LysR family n=1 Tax=Marininema halotolerans TaxID=1155944 RepID=A0A1I6TLQ6_9BACL|nr:LysR family transcriptional regulator [Marininema halotolerans]SFS90149.1 DNA-binding transcriptional regulator, LysR family [Marininema halotolerans]
MNFIDLEIFKTVAQHKSITKAAEELNYVQSHITNRIAHVEKAVNAQLFYRHRRGMILTPNGRILIQYADEILQLINDVKKKFIQPKELMKIGSTDSISSIYLPKLILKYHHSYPEVDISLITSSSENLIKKILNYEIDSAFIVGSTNQLDIVSYPYKEEELVLISSSDYHSIRNAKDLENQTILVFNKGCYHRFLLENWLKDENIHSFKKIEFDTIEGIIGCVQAGLGIAIVSQSIAQKYSHWQIKSHPIPSKYNRVLINLIQRKDNQLSLALSNFTKMAEEKYGV